MRLKDRKAAAAIRKVIRSTVKSHRDRKLNTVVSVVYKTGHRSLVHIFRTLDSRGYREAKLKEISEMVIASGARYYTDTVVDIYSVDTRGYSSVAYGPLALLEHMSGQGFTAQAMRENGWNTKQALLLSKLGVNDFKRAIAILVEDGNIVVLRNGFIWWRAVAEAKFGEDLVQYTPEEILQ